MRESPGTRKQPSNCPPALTCSRHEFGSLVPRLRAAPIEAKHRVTATADMLDYPAALIPAACAAATPRSSLVTVSATEPCTTTVTALSSAPGSSSVSNWLRSNDAGMYLMGALAEPVRDQPLVAPKIDQGDALAVAHGDPAIGALEVRTRDDARLSRREAIVYPACHRFQPRLAILVVQGVAGPHLLDVCRGVQIVTLQVRPSQQPLQFQRDRRLAASRHAHHQQNGLANMPGGVRFLGGCGGIRTGRLT